MFCRLLLEPRMKGKKELANGQHKQTFFRPRTDIHLYFSSPIPKRQRRNVEECMLLVILAIAVIDQNTLLALPCLGSCSIRELKSLLSPSSIKSGSRGWAQPWKSVNCVFFVFFPLGYPFQETMLSSVRACNRLSEIWEPYLELFRPPFFTGSSTNEYVESRPIHSICFWAIDGSSRRFSWFREYR